jgi:hypothetical protein
MAPRFLHVANGSSVTMTLDAAGVPGRYSIWADPLYEGPVPDGIDDEELLEMRAEFLGPPPEPDGDLREWRRVIERHEAYDELVLWYEHDLFDQLNLIQLLTFIRDRVPASKPVSLICIGAFPGRPNFKGLGELEASDLAPLLETRIPVSGAQYELARAAWQAFRAPTPEALDALRREDTSALPFLAAAIARLLQEYPWAIDGVSRSERRLLELAGEGGIGLWQAFPRMQEGETAYYTTDGSLVSLAESLSAASPPLLTRDRSPATDDRPLRDRISLTDAGRSVLAGRLDRVAACGIDRWIGGVHLQGRDRVWRWDDARRTVARR